MALTTTTIGNKVRGVYDNVKDTFPASIAPTSGTISSVNTLNKKIVGSGTVFLTDVVPGDYIWFTTIDDLVKVENIVSDTELTLVKPVASTVTAVAWKVVKKSDLSFRNISWLIDSAGTAEINTVVYPASTSESDGDVKPNGEGGGRRLSPIIVDSTTNANIVYVTGV